MADKLFLNKKQTEELKKYCRGCRYFNPATAAKDICSIIAWIRKDDLITVVNFAKRCPCNDKCLVKASCMESECPIWMKSMKLMMKERQKR